MKQRKIPMRKCVVSGESFEKSSLTRVVVSKDEKVFIDTTGKANGRGAYILLTKENLDKAIKSKKLDKSLRTDVPKEIYSELYSLCDSDDIE